MPYNLSLSLNNPDNVYTPSSEVEGYITFDLRETIKVKAIRVCVEGLATTKWLLSESSKSSHGRSREVSYSAKVSYLNEELLVWKPSEGHAKSSIFPGIHVYPFKFIIPSNVPPSFEGDHGNIRFHIKTTVERPWKTNRSVTKYFTVLPTKDLNTIPTAGEEMSSRRSKKVGFFIFHHGKVDLQMHIPKKGYVPGETICVDTEIYNCSSRPIVKAECYLTQQCRFLAYRYGMGGTTPDESTSQEDRYLSRKRDETRIVTSIQELNIPARSEQKSKMRVTIPCICPAFDSSLIHVEYYIVVKLHVKCRIRKTIKTECPVVIGSVPLLEENVDPRTPIFGEATIFSPLTSRSMQSVEEKITPKYVYYPKFGKSKEDEVDEPPSLTDLHLPPIDSICEDYD